MMPDRRMPDTEGRPELEDLLRRDARAARRAPPATIRPWVLAALRGPPARPATSIVRRRLAIAAGLALAVLAPLLATRASRPGASSVAVLAPSAAPASGAQARVRALRRLAESPPRALRSALEEPLLAEAGKVRDDAVSAARFLVGRLPPTLALERILSPP